MSNAPIGKDEFCRLLETGLIVRIDYAVIRLLSFSCSSLIVYSEASHERVDLPQNSGFIR
jgi:hypothetical protein